jgi:hypothetical protein
MRYPTLLVTASSATLFLGTLRADAPAAADSIPPAALAPPAQGAAPLTPQEEGVAQRFGLTAPSQAGSPQAFAGQSDATQAGGRRGAVGRRLYAALLAHFDQGGKGYLTPEEQAKALATLAERRPRIYAALLRRFDANGDGKLDAGETAHLFAVLAAVSAPPPAASRPPA